MKLFKLAFICLLPLTANAKDIAECSNPSGRTYFPHVGMVPAQKAGWGDDTIKGGITKVTVNEKGEYDVLFVDASKSIISSTEDGGKVVLFAKGSQSFGLLILYPGKTVETYTFFKTNSGKLEYTNTTTRAGDELPLLKTSLMRGACSFINLENVK